MPGGGKFVTASDFSGGQIHINNPGEVAFNAVLDTDFNSDGTNDTGLFVLSRGSLRLVAKSGADIDIPGGGTIFYLAMPASDPIPPFVNSGAINNDRGQVVFAATLVDGRGVLLLATPTARQSR